MMLLNDGRTYYNATSIESGDDDDDDDDDDDMKGATINDDGSGFPVLDPNA